MLNLDPSLLSSLLMMQQMAPRMPTQPLPPQMHQTRMMQPAALTAGPSMMYNPQPSQGLQVPPGYNYDPRSGQQYGIPQGGSNNLQYTYPGGILGAGAYRPHTG